METCKWWGRSGAELERALQEGPKGISSEGGRTGWEPRARLARFILKPVLGHGVLRMESGLIGPWLRLQGDRCLQRPPPTCVGAPLHPCFPVTLPFQLAQMLPLTSSFPCLCSCASVTCSFYPHFSFTTSHYVFSHINQRRKFRKTALPDLLPLTTRIFQKKSPSFYSSRSLYIYSLYSKYPSSFSPGELLLLFLFHLLQEIFPNPDQAESTAPCKSTQLLGSLLSQY